VDDCENTHLLGTFENELAFGGQAPIPPTGEPITLEMSFLHEVDENGLVVEDWEFFDQLSLLSQLGVIEGAAEATEPAA
jgi:hypothetical protein